MSTKPLPSEMSEYSLLEEEERAPSWYRVFAVWCTYLSGFLAIIQMAYGIGLVFFFFFSFDTNYEKWELPGVMVLAMIFTGFIVQASALLVIIGHIQRNARYVYLGCVFPFLECARTAFIVLKSIYEIIFEETGRVMSEETWINTVNSLFFLAVLSWFFSISVVTHLKTAFVIEHNEDQVDEE